MGADRRFRVAAAGRREEPHDLLDSERSVLRIGGQALRRLQDLVSRRHRSHATPRSVFGNGPLRADRGARDFHYPRSAWDDFHGSWAALHSPGSALSGLTEPESTPSHHRPLPTIGYALFDTHDTYDTYGIAIYSARYGCHTQWPLDELLATLAERPVNLSEERERVRRLLERPLSSWAFNSTLIWPALKRPATSR
jgi:hypothetical protein